MNNESTPLRMRAFRVIDRRDGNYSKWIVIEDVERAQFRTGSHVSGSSPLRGMKAEIDRSDAWDVLNSLRNAARFPESDQIHRPLGASIDAAITQDEIRLQELLEWARHGTVAKEPEPNGQRSKPIIVAAPDGHTSDDELQRMIEEVWDFAGGKRLKWKPIGRTPAGRRCEVLTFDGSEEVLIGTTSVEIPARSNKCDIE